MVSGSVSGSVSGMVRDLSAAGLKYLQLSRSAARDHIQAAPVVIIQII
jgi:hypothetical protein